MRKDEMILEENLAEIACIGREKIYTHLGLEWRSSMDRWSILIVDRESEMHTTYKMQFREFYFDNKGIRLINAYSVKEAVKVLEDDSSIALILLDAAIEGEESGLKLVKYIRETLKNRVIRIILRVDGSEELLEEKVFVQYDIHDCKEKWECLGKKLKVATVASLRSYNDLLTIENSRSGLRKVIESSVNIFEIKSMNEFASGVLKQLISILRLNQNAFYSQVMGFTVLKRNSDFRILGATGSYYHYMNKKMKEVVNREVLFYLEKAIKEKRNIYFGDKLIVYFEGKHGSESLVYLEGIKKLTMWDIDLIEVFAGNVSLAFENLYLNKEIEDTQREIIFTLGEIAEIKSKETGNHVKRVAEYSKVLALGYGLPYEETEAIRLASPMHDIGKIGIPDEILSKPGKLTEEEFNIIKSHTTIGYEMLKNSNRYIMKTAEIIALQHHEKYNGKGYPYGLKGEEIHIFGRITAIADVFDALGSDRVYKKAWELDRILEYMKKEEGEQFDPQLLKIFFESLDEILKIRDQFKEI